MQGALPMLRVLWIHYFNNIILNTKKQEEGKDMFENNFVDKKDIVGSKY